MVGFTNERAFVVCILYLLASWVPESAVLELSVLVTLGGSSTGSAAAYPQTAMKVALDIMVTSTRRM